MAQFATGVFKRLYLAPEVTEGVIPPTGARTMRRVTADFSLSKDAYQSREILSSQQIRDARHGVRRATGTYQGQLSCGSYYDIFQGLTRGTWVTGVSFPNLATVSVALNPSATASSGVISANGSLFMTAGMRVGDVVKMSGFTGAQAALNGAPMRVSDVSDNSFGTTDIPATITAGFSANNISIQVVGSKVFPPASGQIDRSYSIEQWYSDILQSEVFVGCKVGQVSLNMPSTGMIDVSATFTGIDMIQGVVQTLQPAKPPTGGNSLAAVDGKLYMRNNQNGTFPAGSTLGTITGMNLQISRTLQANPVVGANTVPHVFTGMLTAQGSMTAMFQDQTFLNAFLAENELAVGLTLTTDGSASPDFVNIFMPRVKIMSSNKSDSDLSLVTSMNFQALENYQTTSMDLTTIMFQDSTVTAGF